MEMKHIHMYARLYQRIEDYSIFIQSEDGLTPIKIYRFRYMRERAKVCEDSVIKKLHTRFSPPLA